MRPTHLAVFGVLLMGADDCTGSAQPVGIRGPVARSAHERVDERRRMVESQIAHPRDGRDPVTDPRVIAAMLAVPRHAFVPAPVSDQAYGDTPLPIGHGQTISQPYIVALMTEQSEAAARREGPGGRKRLRLPGGGARPPDAERLHDRNRRGAWPGRRGSASRTRATPVFRFGRATAISDGPSRRRSTPSSSPARRTRSRRRCGVSSSRAAGSSSRSAPSIACSGWWWCRRRRTASVAPRRSPTSASFP